MPGFKPFLAGLLAGGCLSCVALQYHVVRSDEGMYLVPRSPKPSLTDSYADTRNWSAEKWTQNQLLADALRANGAADLLAGKTEARDELQDAMNASLGDVALPGFDSHFNDPLADSGMFRANKPVNKVRDSIDRLRADNSLDSGQDGNRRDGFLDDVRSELDQTFGDWDREEHTTRRPVSPRRPSFNSQDSSFGNLTNDVQRARQRMRSSIDDSLDNDIFSDSLDEFGSRFGNDSPAPQPQDVRDPSEMYEPTFDTDDDILDRFAPSSANVGTRTSVVSLPEPKWDDDPWADSQTTQADGWIPTQKTATQSGNNTGLLSNTLGKFNNKASEIARDTLQRGGSAVTDPIRKSLESTRDRTLESVTDSVRKKAQESSDWIDDALDANGLFSPFREIPE
ncbi:hypothetical protein OAH18_00700 [bacterium]|nr:hypothetical protein [bacterium]